MLIQMQGTYRGCDNGFDVRCYEKGTFLIVGQDIGDILARGFINNGQARVVKEEVVNGLIASPYLNEAFA